MYGVFNKSPDSGIWTIAHFKDKIDNLSHTLQEELGLENTDVSILSSCNHSDIAICTGTPDQTGKERKYIAKHYHHLQRTVGEHDTYLKDPDSLLAKESRNLTLINQIIPGLVPKIYQRNVERFIIMEYIEGRNYAEYIKERDIVFRAYHTRLKREDRHLLYDLVEDIAYFNGCCTANQDQFLKAFPEYQHEAAIAFNNMFDILREDIDRLQPSRTADRIVPSCLDGIISQIKEGYEKINLPLEFSHGDCNPLHVIRVGTSHQREIVGRSILVDLETFNLYYQPHDLCSVLMYKKIGPNSLFNQGEFHHLIERYLCFEYAARMKDTPLMEQFQAFSKRDFRNYIGQENVKSLPEYASFNVGFIVEALLKEIHFYAQETTQARTSEEKEEKKKEWRENIKFLFERVAQYQLFLNVIDENSKSNTTRKMFSAIGEILNYIDATQISQATLLHIKIGYTNTVPFELPPFARK